MVRIRREPPHPWVKHFCCWLPQNAASLPWPRPELMRFMQLLFWMSHALRLAESLSVKASPVQRASHVSKKRPAERGWEGARVRLPFTTKGRSPPPVFWIAGLSPNPPAAEAAITCQLAIALRHEFVLCCR